MDVGGAEETSYISGRTSLGELTRYIVFGSREGDRRGRRVWDVGEFLMEGRRSGRTAYCPKLAVDVTTFRMYDINHLSPTKCKYYEILKKEL